MSENNNSQNKCLDKLVDVAIEGREFGVVVKGIRKKSVAKTVKEMKQGNVKDVNVKIKDIKKIDILNSNGTIDQTVFGGKNIT